MDIRLFLTGGMFLSGIFSILFGLGYFFKIHSLAFFIIMQVRSMTISNYLYFSMLEQQVYSRVSRIFKSSKSSSHFLNNTAKLDILS